MRSWNSTAFCGVSDQAPINFCPLYSHSSAGMMLTLLTADGRAWLAEVALPAAAREQVTVALGMIDALDAQLPALDKLDLRWTTLSPPAWLAQLEARGVLVYR